MKVSTAIALVLVVMSAAAGTQSAHGATPGSVQIDADPASPGIQTTASVGVSFPFTVAVVVGDAPDVEAFNFEVTYDQTKLSSPTISVGSDLDRNPDANQAVLAATGRVWACSPPPPVGDDDPSPTVGAAFLSCYSTGVPAGPTFNSTGSVIATVQFTALTTGSSALNLRNVNVFKSGGTETGSCNPTIVIAATCVGATITATLVTPTPTNTSTSTPTPTATNTSVLSSPTPTPTHAISSVGGIAEPPDVAALPGKSNASARGDSTLILGEIAIALALTAAASLYAWRRR